MKSFSLLLLSGLVACSSTRSLSKRSLPYSQSTLQREEKGDEGPAKNFVDNPPLRWPTRYPYIVAYFGWRKKRMHEGLDLKAPTGTRVYSASAGEVIEAGSRIRGYGKTIVIDHGNGWSTLYAHLSKIKVKRGMTVDPGDLIALSGRTGRASGPHLHFELRKGSDPLDPLMFLPPVEGDDNRSDQPELGMRERGRAPPRSTEHGRT